MSATIVVGAGQAAAAFAAKLRELQPDRAIKIIGEEPVLPYQRPPLSKKYMTGEMSLDRLLLRPAEWFAEHGIECRTGVAVDSIDRDEKALVLSDETVLKYDRLLIATGATPRRLASAAGGGNSATGLGSPRLLLESRRMLDKSWYDRAEAIQTTIVQLRDSL